MLMWIAQYNLPPKEKIDRHPKMTWQDIPKIFLKSNEITYQNKRLNNK